MGRRSTSERSEEGDRIRAIRRTMGLSQGEMATAAGMSQTQLSLLETGARKPTLALLRRSAEASLCSVGELVGFIEGESDSLVVGHERRVPEIPKHEGPEG